jgi:hypothetical protein
MVLLSLYTWLKNRLDNPFMKMVTLDRSKTLAVISDTHGLIRPALSRHLEDRGSVIHAGDLGGWMVEEELIQDHSFYAVQGNVDSPEPITRPLRRLFQYGSYRIGMIHIALDYRDQLLMDVAHWCRDDELDMLVFGHTHKPLIRKEESGLLLFNPGSCGPRRPHKPVTAGTLGLDEENQLIPHVVSLEGATDFQFRID